MPIFTPCADACAANNRLPAAAAAIQTDFISRLPAVSKNTMLNQALGIFDNPAPAHLFQISQ
jgi:hypothetical protein